MRRFVVFLLAILIPLSFVSANAGGESAGNSGYSLYYLPSMVANNQNVFVELSQAKSVNESTLGSVYADAVSSNYGNNNLVVFCLMDSLNKSVQTSNVNVTITSSDSTGFYFKKDGNETIKVPFEIEVVCSAFYKGNNATTYATRLLREKLTAPESLSQQYTTTRKTADFINIFGYLIPYNERDDTQNYNFSSSFEKTGLNTYTLSAYTSECTNTMNTNKPELRDENNDKYPNILTYYYICIKLPSDQSLQPGQYTATFTLEATFNSKDVNGTVKNGDSISETINVKGYIGEEPEVVDSDYSFFLASGANTFFMDLEVEYGTPTPPPYDIAKVQFYYTTITTSDSDPASTNQRRAYKIYISPGETYTDNGSYYFIRNGTERQERTFANTIYYDLLVETSQGSYELLSASSDYTGNGNSAKANAQSHFTTSKIGGVTTLNGTNTYQFYPLYDSQQTSSGANNKWKETWELDMHVYLQVRDESKEIYSGDGARRHQEGMYTSTIYFTVVSP